VSAPHPVPYHVFTPDWIAEQKRKYGQSPEHARPRLYYFWTSSETEGLRNLIEQWVDFLSPKNRQRVIPRLRATEQLRQTCNELAVGDSLRRMGHAVEYEVELQGLTPDWVVCVAGTGSKFILEVVSSKPPQERERCDDGWDILRRRLEGLSGNAHLCIQPPFNIGDDEPVAPPSEQRQKQIVRNVREWLESAPPDGAEVAIDGVVIGLVCRIPNLDHVTCGTGCMPFCVDAAPLKESVKDKAKKYREIVRALQLPFVVCVIPDFSTGRGLDDLQSAVLGEQRCRLWRSPQGVYRQEYYRDNDGLFAKYPTLSAVTLGEWKSRELTHVMLHNPLATYPLDERAFPSATSGAKGA
jgi:hypothetical protein